MLAMMTITASANTPALEKNAPASAEKNTPAPAPVTVCQISELSNFDITSKRINTSSPFEFDIYATFVNYNPNAAYFDICWGLFDTADNLLELSSIKHQTIDNGYLLRDVYHCLLGSHLGNGTYYIKPLSKSSNDQMIELCKDYENFIIIMTITDGTQAYFHKTGPIKR